MTPLATIKRLIQLARESGLVAGFVLMVVAGLVVVAIPVGLALVFLALTAMRRGLGNACARLLGRSELPPKEAG